MKRITYQKLVRDRIPEIIKASGCKAIYQQLSSQEKLPYLQEKLKEEMSEYLESSSLEELADILEVIHGIVDQQGYTWDDLEAIRLHKMQERGSFEESILLIEVIEP